MQLRVHERKVGPATVLSLDGELDLVTAPLLRQKVVSAVSEGARLLVLDLSGLTHLDSTGLGQVVASLRRVRAHDGELAVVVPDPHVRRIFQICDLDRVLVLNQTVDEALAEVGAA